MKTTCALALVLVGTACAGSTSNTASGSAISTGTSTGSAPTTSSGTGGSTGGTTGTTGSSVPRIDEVAYYQQLVALRPDVLTPAATCYDAMVLKQVFRPEFLSDAGLSFGDIVQANDSTSQASTDQAWILSQQQAEVAFCQADPVAGCAYICASSCAACPSGTLTDGTGALPASYVSGYNLCAFVGYEEGDYAKIYDSSGVDYKVFFEFADVESALTPSLFQTYSAQLADAGYFGDAKILTDPSIAWQPRIQYNEIITHGHSVADAETAERIGLSLFEGQLTGHGRGLDVGTPPTESDALDWHAYLCANAGSLSALPAEAVAYVTYAD